MRSGAWLLALTAALQLNACTARAGPIGAHPVAVTVQSVALQPGAPARTKVGELTYAGGLVLTGDDKAHFGGFSGLVAKPDGRFLSQSDEGWLMAGRIVTDDAGKLTGVGAATLTPLLDEQGAPFRRKYLADAEDIAFLDDPAHPDGFVISFEGDVNVGRSRVSFYDSPASPEHVVYRAEWADTVYKLGPNYSFEAVTRCPGQSRLLLGSEDGQIAFLDPKAGRIENRNLIAPAPENFKLTGLDCMADGRIFALYRAFDPIRSWRAMVASLTWEASPKGPVLRRHELARLEGSLTRDNMEGIAAIPGRDGPNGERSVRLYLISDDNFNELEARLVGGQRTLLLAFDWTPPPPPQP